MDATALAADLAPRLMVILGAAVTVLAVVGAVASAMTRRGIPAARIAAATGFGGRAEPESGRGGRIRPVDAMRRVLTRLDLMRSGQTTSLQQFLATAGWRSKSAVVVYLFAKLTLPLTLGGIVAFLLYWWAPALIAGNLKLLVVLAAVFLGTYLPDATVRRAAGKRRDTIRLALPDALDLLVICVEAGLSLDAAVERVGEEFAPTCPALSDELGLLSAELSFLGDRRRAFDNLTRRVDLAPVQALVATLVQTERFGTPIAQALRVLSTEQRNMRMVAAEEKAARLPATMTIPMILFILPALFVVLLGPAILKIIDALDKF
ncbi:type II secretion system F family protein [Thalassobaculum sp.]|uniref:type II secretion system F family protein n=1 Tax=Thalassobaculum sp. TaxID=2022740 RepID=UPI0032EDB6AC